MSRMRLYVTLTTVFVMGMSAGVWTCYRQMERFRADLAVATSTGSCATDIAEGALDLNRKWEQETRRLADSLQRCVELQAHRAKAGK